MARFRLAQPAQNDLANILATSAERWGTEGRRRYARLLAAAMRVVAANPEGPLTQARNELSPGLRSDHFTAGNVLHRLFSLKRDPWQGFFKIHQHLPQFRPGS